MVDLGFVVGWFLVDVVVEERLTAPACRDDDDVAADRRLVSTDCLVPLDLRLELVFFRRSAFVLRDPEVFLALDDDDEGRRLLAEQRALDVRPVPAAEADRDLDL